MSRNRKPTAVLEASGAFRHDPARGVARANEPRPAGPLGAMPEDFLRDTPESKKHRDAWEQILAMAPRGVLTASDTAHVELTARAMVICRRSTATSSDRKDLARLLADIGCSPVGRTRIQVERGRSNAASEPGADGWAALDADRVAGSPRTN